MKAKYISNMNLWPLIIFYHPVDIQKYLFSIPRINNPLDKFKNKAKALAATRKLTFKLRPDKKLVTSSLTKLSIALCLSTTLFAWSISCSIIISLPLLEALASWALTRLTPLTISKLSLSKNSLALLNSVFCTHDMLSFCRQSSILCAVAAARIATKKKKKNPACLMFRLMRIYFGVYVYLRVCLLGRAGSQRVRHAGVSPLLYIPAGSSAVAVATADRDSRRPTRTRTRAIYVHCSTHNTHTREYVCPRLFFSARKPVHAIARSFVPARWNFRVVQPTRCLPYIRQHSARALPLRPLPPFFRTLRQRSFLFYLTCVCVCACTHNAAHYTLGDFSRGVICVGRKSE